MLWIALHLPKLPLEALTPSHEPAARCVIEEHAVRVANDAAEAAGIHPGCRKATALALLPELELLERDPVKEGRFLESLALALLRFTPHVALEAGGLVMEVQGSLRLFGGLKSLVRQIQAVVADHSAHHAIGLATTPGAAAFIARSPLRRRHALKPEHTAALLDLVPIALLASAQAHLDVIAGLGCETLADLRKLPRGGLKRRFGVPLLKELDRAYGEEPDLRDRFLPPESFRAEIELTARVDNAEALLFASRRLIQQLCGWLAAHWTAVSQFRLVMKHESTRRAQHDSTLELSLAEGSRSPEHLLTVLKERLSRFVLKAPVYHLGLEVDRVAPFAGENAAFFPDPARAEADFTRLVDRLKARLGEENVHRLAMTEDVRPERSFKPVPVDNRYPAVPIAPHLPRPSWLLPAPIRLLERDNQPFYQSRLSLVAGPERIEYGWYDGALIQRDYYVAENDSHALLWIYRERDALEGGWYLQGLFG